MDVRRCSSFGRFRQKRVYFMGMIIRKASWRRDKQRTLNLFLTPSTAKAASKAKLLRIGAEIYSLFFVFTSFLSFWQMILWEHTLCYDHVIERSKFELEIWSHSGFVNNLLYWLIVFGSSWVSRQTLIFINICPIKHICLQFTLNQ